jgi:FixJ family two-component response regulator
MQKSTPKAQVILIEDDQSLRFMLCQTLNRYGFVTIDFSTPAEFFAWLAQTTPPRSCLLLDMRLPAMSGLEVQARLLASGTQFSIIFMSGDSHIGEAIVGMKQGAVDFLLKPFDETSLIKAINRSLSQLDCAENRTNPYHLTARESLIIDYISEGLKSEEIARTLNLTVRTIKMHRSNILHKTGSKTITEAVLRVHAPVSVGA